MISDEGLRKGMLMLRVIWFGMFGSLALYLFMGLQAAGTLQASMNEDTFATLKLALYALALVTLLMTRYIRGLIVSSKKQYRQAIQYFQDPVLQKYATALVVSWAMAESIGIYGLVLFFLGKNTTDLYLLLLVSAAAMIAYRPRKDEAIRLSQKSREDSKTGGAIG